MQFFSKDSLSLSCEGNSTEWRVRRFIKYDHLAYCSSWGTMTGSTCSINSNGISGVYWCESETGQFSNAANITVQSGDVILVSSVHPVTEGHSVTLSCRLRTEKVLYSVDFYKNGKLISNDASGELFISEVTKSDEGFYKCEGRDSSQGFRSLKSPKSWLSVKYFHPAASLTVSPPRMQFFSKESLSLSCEGNSPEWRVRRFIKYVHLAYCSSLGTMTGSTCSINSIGISGVYWCESETGQFSNAANITVQSGDVILVSSVHPVTEGHSVTLSCRLRTEKVLYKVDFYKNDKLISNDASGELFISEVTKSDEGFYKCEGRDSPQGFRSLTSPESWLSVKCEYKIKNAVIISLIILLLLVLYCYRKSKGEICSF
uniref:Ig-like domain-containing protein n=1 Tax=Cyclopterus lumpus TaxID=8103 RepID=A0A8C2Z7F8_CYCLU